MQAAEGFEPVRYLTLAVQENEYPEFKSDRRFSVGICPSLLILSATQSPEASWSNVVGYGHAVPNPAQGHQCNLLEADFWTGMISGEPVIRPESSAGLSRNCLSVPIIDGQ
jgi:hypothetical protein